MIVALRTKVDRPAPFTLTRSGSSAVPARFGTDSLFCEAYVAPASPPSEKFIFMNGGVRGRGAAGASKKHVWAPDQRSNTSMAGGPYSVRLR